MIAIANFVQTPEINSYLKTLPINKYHIVTGEIGNTKSYETSDILILNQNQVKKLRQFIQKNNVTFLMYVEQSMSHANAYNFAKSEGAFAVFSATDIKRLSQIIDDANTAVLEFRKKQFGKGKTIGIFSLKGGVGKSLISYHLASTLSTYTKSEPLLIDAAVPFGSAQALLNIQSKSSWQVLRPLLKTGKDLTSTRLNAQVTKTEFQFNILAAPNKLNEEPLSSSEVNNLLSEVKHTYPITIVDLSVIRSSQLTEYSKLFDLIIWVLTPDANSIVQTLESAKELEKIKSEIIFVANMVEPQTDLQLISTVAHRLLPSKTLIIDQDSEAVKLHQRKFELIKDESLLLTRQLQELSQAVFFKLSENSIAV